MPMIETINLTKKYGDLIALNNLNLQIDEGACCGFIGPNGAGKTTTINCLTGGCRRGRAQSLRRAASAADSCR